MTRFAKPLVTAGILVVGLAGTALIFAMKPRAEAVPRPPRAPVVRVTRVAPAPYDFVVRAHGTVVPRREGDLAELPAGPISSGRMLVAAKFVGGQQPVRLLDNLSLDDCTEPPVGSASGGGPGA